MHEGHDVAGSCDGSHRLRSAVSARCNRQYTPRIICTLCFISSTHIRTYPYFEDLLTSIAEDVVRLCDLPSTRSVSKLLNVHCTAKNKPQKSWRRCGRGKPSPGADAAGVSPVPVRLQLRAKSWCGCGRGDPNPDADKAQARPPVPPHRRGGCPQRRGWRQLRVACSLYLARVCVRASVRAHQDTNSHARTQARAEAQGLTCCAADSAGGRIGNRDSVVVRVVLDSHLRRATNVATPRWLQQTATQRCNRAPKVATCCTVGPVARVADCCRRSNHGRELSGNGGRRVR